MAPSTAQAPALQAPPRQIPAAPPDALQAVSSVTTETMQAPLVQATARQTAGAGQSATAWHAQRRRPERSLGPHALEQQWADSLQLLPTGRQAAASVRPSSTRPRAPAARPATIRRRVPRADSERVRASKREPSTGQPPSRVWGERLSR